MKHLSITAFAALAAVGTSNAVQAQIISAAYASNYTVVDLGTPDVPAPFGGINFLNSNTLLIGGRANNSDGRVFAVTVARDSNNNIVGFVGTPTVHCESPGIDGGLWYMPNGTLAFTTYSGNTLGQVLPGNSFVSRSVGLDGFGIPNSTGTGTIIPSGFHGAGSLIIGSYSAGSWWILPFSPDGASGLYNFATATRSAFTGGGPEGIVYVPTTSPRFGIQSVLISEYISGAVAAFEIDEFGLPIASTRQLFMEGLSGAEGGVLDPVTGQFLFSTFGGFNRVVVVRGFTQSQPNGGCQPADICDDNGAPLPSSDRNTGVNEGDYNGFFAGFFDALTYCDQWDDAGIPLTNPNHGGNNGVNEGDYNGFFSSFFNGCP